MPEEKPEEHKKRFKIPKISLKKWDIVSIIALAIFLILVTIPVYSNRENCEVARPNFKCATIKDVMIENCNYWGKYDCNTGADASLPQIEWYIGNLCELQNKYHNANLECADLRSSCNQITGTQTCPLSSFNK